MLGLANRPSVWHVFWCVGPTKLSSFLASGSHQAYEFSDVWVTGHTSFDRYPYSQAALGQQKTHASQVRGFEAPYFYNFSFDAPLLWSSCRHCSVAYRHVPPTLRCSCVHHTGRCPLPCRALTAWSEVRHPHPSPTRLTRSMWSRSGSGTDMDPICREIMGSGYTVEKDACSKLCNSRFLFRSAFLKG
jgi:hypothetical protein